MAHEIDTTTGRAAMAYVGETPWHGLGQALIPGASFDEWLKAAGMNYTIRTAPVMAQTPDEHVIEMPDRLVAYRDDTKAPLSILSPKYHLVQPAEVLRFFEDLVEAGGFTLETAGVLFGGRRYWALAKMNESAVIAGSDRIESYLLLASSCDGLLATHAQFTSVRVVCNNTLGFAVRRAERGTEKAVRMMHLSAFNAEKCKEQLGLAEPSFAAYIERVRALAATKVGEAQARAFIKTLFGDQEKPEAVTRAETAVFDLFNGGAIGADLESANGTAWGLVNAVTEYLDHIAGRSQDRRLDSAWFGKGASLKRDAFDAACELAGVEA